MAATGSLGLRNMNLKNIEKLIRNLGYPYEALVSNEIIENLPLVQAYEDDETLELTLLPGLELIFWADTQVLEMIYINLDKMNNGERAYQGALPAYLEGLSTRKDVHAKLGKPMFSKSLLELQGTGYEGWDTYQLDNKMHPAALLEFQYIEDMEISKLVISLMDKNV
jgi:hypothetical protein